MPASPGGRLVPGRSGGSMVWQANTPSQPNAAPLTPPASQTSSNPLDASSLPALGSPLNGNGGSGRSPLDAPSLPALGSPLNSNGGSGRSPLDAPGLPALGSPVNSNAGGGRGPLDAPGLPPLEFGGAFANGGIAPGGRASLVGERGPELIVPSGPTAVVPLRAAPMVSPDYSLNAAPRQVGRSMNDPQRMQEIAMRRMRSQGDFAGAAKLAQNQAWLDARFLGRQAPGLPVGAMPVPLQSPNAGANAMPPGGKLVPGRSAGSMVWQPDAPPVSPNPPASSPPAMPSLPMPSMSPPAMPMPAPMQPPALPDFTPAGGQSPLDGPQLPALTDAPYGAYPGAPPMVSSLPIPGTDLVLPIIGGMPKGTPVARSQPPKPEAPKIPDGIQWEKDAMGKIIGGVYPTYNDQGKLVMRRIDADGNGVVTPAEQAAAMQAAGQTPGGVKFSRVQ